MTISEFLYRTVQGPDGEPSSARVAGLFLIFSGVVEMVLLIDFGMTSIALYSFGLIKEIPNLKDLADIIYNMLLVGAGLIGYGKLNDKIGEILASKKS